MEIKGKIHVVNATEVVSDKFKKRTFVIKTDGQYPQHIQLECKQDKVNLLDTVQVGQEVTAHINIEGREYTKEGVTKYFNTIVAWKIEAQPMVDKTPFNDDPFGA